VSAAKPRTKAPDSAPKAPAPTTHATLDEAMLAFQAEVENPIADALGEHDNPYAKLASQLTPVRRLMARHGLRLKMKPVQTQYEAGVEAEVRHPASAGTDDFGAIMFRYDGTPWAGASAFTYASRYMLGLITNTAAGDDDGSLAQHARIASKPSPGGGAGVSPLTPAPPAPQRQAQREAGAIKDWRAKKIMTLARKVFADPETELREELAQLKATSVDELTEEQGYELHHKLSALADGVR